MSFSKRWVCFNQDRRRRSLKKIKIVGLVKVVTLLRAFVKFKQGKCSGLIKASNVINII